MARRRIRDEGDARQCLAAVKASGLSRGQWAQRHGIDGRSLFAWAKNLEGGEGSRGMKEKGKGKKHSGLVELVPGARRAASRYVIRCGQLAVEVDEHFDETTLGRLLKVVSAC